MRPVHQRPPLIWILSGYYAYWGFVAGALPVLFGYFSFALPPVFSLAFAAVCVAGAVLLFSMRKLAVAALALVLALSIAGRAYEVAKFPRVTRTTASLAAEFAPLILGFGYSLYLRRRAYLT